MSDLKSVKDLSLQQVTKQDVSNLEISKYSQHPSIVSLHLTPTEFRKYAAIIKAMVDNDTAAIKLIRDTDGKLKLKSTSITQTGKIDNIRRNYLIRNFSDEHLDIMLNHHFFPKVDPTKATLLRRYKTFVETNSANHGLYVYGKVGIGKTYTSIALANELANIGKKIAFVFVPEAIHDIKSGFNTNNSKQIELEEKMKMADVLFLDDIGIEDAT
jgi:predicted AAA+ superfamily ATPase